jgi:predicted O-linked N-acetylglucosamine transferase (SPINDLY family)
MRILKEVPNSYFLIKGPSDEKSSRTFFEKIAEEEGVNCDRLKFMQLTFQKKFIELTWVLLMWYWILIPTTELQLL